MKITKIRFFEYGKDPPKNSRHKGKMNSSTISGYFDYTGREEAKDTEKDIKKQDDGYFGYTGSHTIGTYSSNGKLNSKEDRDAFKEVINQCFSKPGDLCWDIVISLEDDDEANELRLDTAEQWADAMNEVLPQLFKQYDLKYENVVWWFDVHRNTEHPHVHVAFMEKEKTRTRGKLTERNLQNIKRIIHKNISARTKLVEATGVDYKTFFEEKDEQFKTLMTIIQSKDIKNNPKLKDLYKILPKTGRLQYNSYNMKPYQGMIRSVIDDVIKSDSELSRMFDEFTNKLDILESIMNSEGRNLATIKNTEISKFYERVGNHILQNFKKVEIVEDKKENNKTSHRNKNYKTRKIINKNSLKHFIQSALIEQHSEINQNIEDYNKRMEEDMLVK